MDVPVTVSTVSPVNREASHHVFHRKNVSAICERPCRHPGTTPKGTIPTRLGDAGWPIGLAEPSPSPSDDDTPLGLRAQPGVADFVEAQVDQIEREEERHQRYHGRQPPPP